MKNAILILVMAAFATIFSPSSAFAQTADQKVTVIDLSQTPNQFNVTELKLAPGKYQFKVTNQNVDKDLGFVIQKAADKDKDVMKTAVENSFTTSLISKGKTQLTGIVELKVGEYVYSCPLNPTPHYKLVVK
jgi:hypothetical protein